MQCSWTSYRSFKAHSCRTQSWFSNWWCLKVHFSQGVNVQCMRFRHVTQDTAALCVHAACAAIQEQAQTCMLMIMHTSKGALPLSEHNRFAPRPATWIQPQSVDSMWLHCMPEQYLTPQLTVWSHNRLMHLMQNTSNHVHTAVCHLSLSVQSDRRWYQSCRCSVMWHMTEWSLFLKACWDHLNGLRKVNIILSSLFLKACWNHFDSLSKIKIILSPYVNRHRLILHSASTNDDTAARGIGDMIDILPFVPHELANVGHLNARAKLGQP